MKEKILKIKEYYTTHPKRFWIVGGVVVFVCILLLTHKSASTVTVIPVEQKDLKQTILGTGQVTSDTNLDLSFSTSGLVKTLPVAVGTKVYAGQILATLDNGSEYAALKSAQASYEKVVDGASNEDVAVAQAALASAQTSLVNTQKVQDTLVENARRAFLNTDLTPILSSGTTGTAPTVTGTYIGDAEGSYVVTPRATGTNGYFTYSGIETGNGSINTSTPVALGTKGLYIQFSASFSNDTSTTWTVMLPNTKSVGYLTAFNAYQNAVKNRDSAISSATAAVVQAQAALDLKKAPARTADMAVAQAAVDSARALYEKTLLVAPASGTVVHVDTKIGERVDPQKEVVVIQDVNNLYVEANINETNISKVAIGQPVTMTLDAFGPDVYFTGSVIHIDPSSTTTDGVVNFVIKTSIMPPVCTEGDATCASKPAVVIRPGMNANMLITAWTHPNVLVVPKAAVTTDAKNVSTVKIVADDKNDAFKVREVELGLLGDGNLVEVVKGLAVGEKVAVGAK